MGAQTSPAQELNDERAIRDLVDKWLAATRTGDLKTVLSLMDDDVIFMVPGQEPFGKEAFAANSEQMKDTRVEGTSDIREIKILGDWAWMRNHLEVTITPPNGDAMTRTGYTLTILRKNADGAWVLARDANLLT
ncbi:MAG: putative ketosteroid isomerase-like protein [Acidobacteria bacterium]|nr:putative ketosteroid isomerase-like protein [Acidobacteriota bacterium]